MPIDDAITRIEKAEQRKRKTEQEKVLEASLSLVGQAQKLLGDYLSKEFYGGTLTGSMERFVRTFGPFLLDIQPKEQNTYNTSNYGHTTRKDEHTCMLVGKIDRDTWIAVLSTVNEGSLQKTDLANVDNETKELIISREGARYFPEYMAVKERLTGTMGAKPHPYAMVMGMTPKYRPIVAVAIGIGLSKGEIDLASVKEGTNNKKALLKAVLSIEHIAEAAEQYGVTDLQPIIKEFNDIVSKYKARWLD